MGADIQVMSGGAPQEVLAVLIPEFEKKTGHKVHVTYIVIAQIQQRLAAGEKPDMVLMPVPAIEARVKEGVFRGDAWAALGTVRIGMVVREGAAKPDISSARCLQEGDARREVDCARQPGRDAERRAFCQSVGPARHRGRAEAQARSSAMRSMAASRPSPKGEAEIGLYPVSEVIHEKGVTVVGLIPAQVQLNNVYGTAVLSRQRVTRTRNGVRESSLPIPPTRSTGGTAASIRRSSLTPPPSCGSPRCRRSTSAT